MKTREEVEKLKRDWVYDPCWDIETTDGFEEYKDELKAFSEEKRIEFEKQYKENLRQYRLNQPAFPFTYEEEYNERGHKRSVIEKGLTKREYFAGLAMQGLLTQHIKNYDEHTDNKMVPVYPGDYINTKESFAYEALAEDAVSIADAIIKAINQSTNQTTNEL